jgi:hypothetical protein
MTSVGRFFFPLLFHISLGKLGWIRYSPLSSIYCRTLVFFCSLLQLLKKKKVFQMVQVD